MALVHRRNNKERTLSKWSPSAANPAEARGASPLHHGLFLSGSLPGCGLPEELSIPRALPELPVVFPSLDGLTLTP